VTVRYAEASKEKQFRFDTVLGPDADQDAVWEHARLNSLMEQLVSGFHVTVFAYGQTGTGKTHTMEGSGCDCAMQDRGIVARAVEDLFARIEALRRAPAVPSHVQDELTVRFSFSQIYNERIYDLLSTEPITGTGLRLREDPSRQFFVEGLSEFECESPDQFFQFYRRGIQRKQMAMTTMNAASSRSHTMLTLSLVRRSVLVSSADEETASVSSSANSHRAPVARQVISRLTLVDLCGSERTSTSSEVSAARFQETVNINKSLSVLRKVVTALTRRSSSGNRCSEHVPYRESKLTALLQHAIGGNSYLLMLACLSPSQQSADESLNTLQYASQAAQIKNEPMPNTDPKDLMIDGLNQNLLAARNRIEALEQEARLHEVQQERIAKVAARVASLTNESGTARIRIEALEKRPVCMRCSKVWLRGSKPG